MCYIEHYKNKWIINPNKYLLFLDFELFILINNIHIYNTTFLLF